MTHGGYVITPGWRLILRDLGLCAADVLRQADLPGDLLNRERVTLGTEDYFRLWHGIEHVFADPTLPIRIGAAISVESFDPPIFAALCSPDLNTALGRIARYKKLFCPMALHVDVREDRTTLALEWLDAVDPPVSLVATELVYFVELARIATRARIQPLEVTAPIPPAPPADYSAYFGARVRRGPRPTLTFSAADAARPFLTANDGMWRFFEPELTRRLSELDDTAATADRVRAALVELLPGGEVSMEAVSRRLGASTRTLQRRLKNEGVSFQAVLATTRAQLAGHYLESSNLSTAEISFLLGFEDPNSFFRAYHAWTGTTPERARCALREGN